MKTWIIITLCLVAAGLANNIINQNGEGAAETMVQGMGMLILVLAIGGIVWIVKSIRSKSDKSS